MTRLGLLALLFVACRPDHSAPGDEPPEQSTRPAGGDSADAEPKPVDADPPSSEPPEDAAPPRAAAVDGCPPRAPRVEGGAPTPVQQERWRARYPELGSNDIDDFCLELLPLTSGEHEACILSGWCVPDRTQPHICRKSGKDALGKACDYSTRMAIDLDGARDVFAYSPERAVDACALQGRRLQSLSEWLWAASGGPEDRRFAWGNAEPTGKHLNAADPTFSELKCELPQCLDDEEELEIGVQCLNTSCPRGKERSHFSLFDDDGPVGPTAAGSYPDGAGRWGHLDLEGNIAELVRYGDGFMRCGGDATTHRLEEVDLHQTPCKPCEGKCKGAVRCSIDPLGR